DQRDPAARRRRRRRGLRCTAGPGPGYPAGSPDGKAAAAVATFHDALDSLGFVLVQRDRRGSAQYARKPNRYLTEWVHDDGEEALFTWEFDLGDFCASVGW